MLDPARLLITGGSGLLGRELRALLPGADAPSSADFDVTDFKQMDAYVRSRHFDAVLHAAAFISPPKIEEDPLKAVEVNIIGTANVVRLCLRRRLRLVYISTDYVFSGEKGLYSEQEPVSPVNKYAWSKLGGECSAMLHDDSLIIRTSFGPAVFPFEKAFVDQWTSREKVSVIAAKIVALLDKDVRGIIHVGGPRRTVLEYARSLDPARTIGELTAREVSFKVPRDTSLDTRRFQEVAGI